MISKKHKCIFVHVPKTAGTSVRAAFNWRPKNVKKFMRTSRQHLTASHYVDLLGDDYSQFFVFTIVRNPWDRTLSAFFATNQWFGRGKRSRRIVIPSLSKQKKLFNDWLVALYLKKIELPLGLKRFFIPQFDYVIDADGETIVDHIGRFERIGAVWAMLRGRFNINKRPFRGKTIRGNYCDYYRKDGIEIIRELFDADVCKFGYKFEIITKPRNSKPRNSKKIDRRSDPEYIRALKEKRMWREYHLSRGRKVK